VAAALAGSTRAWRDRLQSSEASAVDALCRRHRADARPARAWVYYSHWLTPPGTPKRFRHALLRRRARPRASRPTPDFGEAVELMWLTPAAGAGRASAGLKLLPGHAQATLQDAERLRRAPRRRWPRLRAAGASALT
jgi:hypothetical protein